MVVNINSPGGDFFEGVAIYNLLREHQGRVTVQVMGLAASAASVIAMAGDQILMGDGSFLMIHNAWAVAIGNRHDMADAAKLLEPFDTAMAKVYAARSGVTEAEAARMMDERPGSVPPRRWKTALPTACSMELPPPRMASRRPVGARLWPWSRRRWPRPATLDPCDATP